jgi:hypothetical protein
MTSQIDSVITVLESEVAVPAACCAIVDEGFPPESSLFGTRDGYLNLAICILRFVSKSDSNDASVSGVDAECKAFDDDIKSVMYSLPIRSAWIVGTHLFDCHTNFVSRLSEYVDPQTEFPLLNDPQFADPEK